MLANLWKIPVEEISFSLIYTVRSSKFINFILKIRYLGEVLLPLGFQKADKSWTTISAKLRHTKDVYEPVFEIHMPLVSSDTFELPVEAQNFLTRWTFEDERER
jgi:hypothetical protein